MIQKLSHSIRMEIGERWFKQGLDEHASIASFARFSLQLMAHGAPPRLIDGAARAMRDEVHHAQLCFDFAQKISGLERGPGQFDVSGLLTDETNFLEVLEATVIEGCVEENVAFRFAKRAEEQAGDPEVKRILTLIAEDEGRHCELAWEFLEWALSRSPEYIRNVAMTFNEAISCTPIIENLPSETEQNQKLLIYFGQPPIRQALIFRDEIIEQKIKPRMQSVLENIKHT